MKKKPAKKIKQIWFKPTRGSYLPVSPIGFTIYLAYCAYLIALYDTWYNDGRHFWALITTVIPLAIASALLTQYIASRHSR